MLIEFRLANFRSYAEQRRFSMVAGSGTELPSNIMNSEEAEDFSLLRGAAIYGANASGKSNLVKALAFFRHFVLNSSDSRREDGKIPVQPFLLDRSLAEDPSEFEITFLLDGIRHQYGFVVSRDRVHEEWLTVYPKGKPQTWFHRSLNAKGNPTWSWSRAHFQGDKSRLAKRTRPDALFLSVAAQWNHLQLEPVYEWFRSRLKVANRNLSANAYTRKLLLDDPRFGDWVGDSLRKADTGVSRVLARKIAINKKHLRFPSDTPAEIKDYLAESLSKEPWIEVHTTRRLPGTDEEMEWDLDQESDGTQRMFELLGPIYDVLQKGSVLIMDELDTSLHPYITRELARLFNDPRTNPGNAQLAFTTHDVTLFDPSLFRRDQLWLTAKDRRGRTDLYSLADFSPRKGEALLKGYLSGRYGAVPSLESFGAVPTSGKPASVEAEALMD